LFGVDRIFAFEVKKLLIIVLMLVYGTSVTGATIHLHFCCGQLDDISLSVPKKKACPTKATVADKCCEDKHVELKVKADQQPAAKWIETVKNLTLVNNTASFRTPSVLYWTRVNRFATGPPHEHTSVPLYIQNRVFRI
jgi:hypothetical protein